MNERIKLLVGQAKFMAEETINKQISANAELNAFAEKFAELIARECMDMCKTAVGNADYNTGRLHCLENIKEHFGVNE